LDVQPNSFLFLGFAFGPAVSVAFGPVVSVAFVAFYFRGV
jgi:hypothetical protein